MNRSQTRTGCAALRHYGTGNTRPWEVSPRDQRRDNAWQAQVHGTRILPMDYGRPGFAVRLAGFALSRLRRLNPFGRSSLARGR